MKARAANALARAIKAACLGSASHSAIFCATMKRVQCEVPVDGWCGLTLDPATLMMTGGVHEHGLTPVAIRRLLEIEHGESDVHSLFEIARAKSPIGVLSETGGPPEHSVRYRDVLRPSGYGEELRLALRAGSSCWGALILFRRSGGRAFDADEVALVEQLSEPLADAIRSALISCCASGVGAVRDRALLVVGKDNTIESASAPVDALLIALAEAGPPDPHGLPHTIQAIALEARRLARNPDETRLTSESRVKLGESQWVTLRASAMGDAQDRVVVFIEPSAPLEVASLIVRAYGLTKRESELTRLVLHGFDTEQVADALGISTYTVQDHLKSIFDKIAVRSRKELVAKLFFTHYLPRMQRGVPPGPDGWFVE